MRGQPATTPAPTDQPKPDDEAVVLPEFGVSAQKADRYRPNDTMSVARIRGQLQDTPLSIVVVSKELVQDLGANSMLDATRYFSGITNGRAAGGGGILDRQNFRGFESFSRTVDGLSMFLIPGNNGFQANFEPAFLERVEVVKGPDSILSPTGSPGGSINVITKSPQFERANEVSAEVGNYNAGKITLDSTGAVNSHLAYRVIADYQDGETYVPGSLRIWDVSPQLTYKFSDKSQITVKYFGTQWGLYGAISNPNDNGWYVTDPASILGSTIADTPPPESGFTYKGLNGDTTWSHRVDRVNIGTAEFTSSIADKISVRLAAAIVYDNFNQDAGYITQGNVSETFDPATGQQIAVGKWDPTNVKETATHVKSQNHDEQIQNDYAANFHPGGVSLQPVVGWSYQQGTNPPNYNKTAPLPFINLTNYTFASGPNVGAYYDPAHPDVSQYTTVGVYAKANAWQYQGYGLMKAGFYNDHVFLTGGVSRLWTSNTSFNFLKAPSDPAYRVSLSGHKDTFLGGFLAKPAENVSVYYTFSTNAAITAFNNQPLWQTGKQHEFGVKTEFLNQRISLTAAHYQITQTNLSTPNPAHNLDATLPTNILADQSNHGYEFDAVGGITSNLSIIASYTKMKLRDAFGRRVRNVPDSTANLLLNYHFTEGVLKNLGVFAGVEHQGDSAGETVSSFSGTVPNQPGFVVAPWTVVNTGASYVWNRYRFNLNLDNTLNDKFVWQPAGRNSVSPYPGITIRFTTTVKF